MLHLVNSLHVLSSYYENCVFCFMRMASTRPLPILVDRQGGGSLGNKHTPPWYTGAVALEHVLPGSVKEVVCWEY